MNLTPNQLAMLAGIPPPEPGPVVPIARGQTWRSRTPSRLLIRIRSPYPNASWRVEHLSGPGTAPLSEYTIRSKFDLVGASDGR